MNPSERPTEWIVAVAGLAGALILFTVDRNIAALATAVTAALPALITAGVEYLRNRGKQLGPQE